MAGHLQWPVYSEYVDPNTNTNFPPPQVQPAIGQCNPFGPNTAHASGVQVAMCDGSVRTVSPSVSQATWAAANTPNGGEVLGGDW